MSQEYMVVIVTPNDDSSVDGASAEVLMRFTEPPGDDFLQRLAESRPGERVFCLMGASTWHEECKHNFRSANMGSPDARVYRCVKCGEEEERDVS